MFHQRGVCAVVIFPVLLGLLWQSGACRNQNVNSTTIETQRSVQTGAWGGNQIGMQVTERGAEINYACAHGNIGERITLDADGKFDVTGSHVNESPGPVRVDQKPDSHPARYTGRVDGQTMSLTVTLTDTKQEIGTFTLTYGRGTHLRKCR